METAVTRITADDPLAQSADVVAGNLDKLRDLFPDAFTEGRIDFDVLRQLLGDAIEEEKERYGLTWHGKRKARQLALTPSTGTLRPAPEESVDWDTTQNLMIEGDNLEVLKLLQKSYAGKVKLIYIDPPYNTGKDFVYKDTFGQTIQNYKEITGQVEGGAMISSNTETGGRFHTAWLNMMYPRLRVARDFLTRDGAVFVSCDEGEHPRLRALMDEVFGSENFVADMVWAAGRKGDSRLVSVSHDYIVCYVRDAARLKEAKVEWKQRKKGLEDIYSAHDRLQKKHGDDYSAMTKGLKAWYKGLSDSDPAKAHRHYKYIDKRGVYFAADIAWPGPGGPKYEVKHPRTQKPVALPSNGWRFSKPETMAGLIADDRIHFGEDETTVPNIKRYLKETEYQSPYSVFYQDGRAATKRLKALMGAKCFDFPKDEGVLKEIVEMVTTDSDIVMDFFAGSGTTAHAVMLQNAEDWGQRRYVLVQLPEPLDPKKKETKAAAKCCDKLGKPRFLTELTKERLRRARKKVHEDHPDYKGDFGFRVYKLDSSNIRAWNPDRDDLAQSLFEHVDNLVEGRTEQDVLVELLLKLGLDLCVPIEDREIAGHTVHSVGAGTLFACLPGRPKAITRQDAEALALGIVRWRDALDPAGDTTVVFRDGAFEDDVAKVNLTALLEQHGIKKENVRSL